MFYVCVYILGTTYSAVAVYRNGKGETIPNDKGKRSIPSCVAFTPLRRIIGEKETNFPENFIYGIIIIAIRNRMIINQPYFQVLNV